MLKKLLVGAALLGGAMFAAGTASAVPVDLGTAATKGGVTQVAWYCNANGRHCVQGPRPGYMVRNGWAPNCRGGWAWNGYACAAPVVVAPPVYAPGVVVRPAPGVKVKVF